MTKKGRPENLKPFKPGQSGNPGGRPKMPDDIREARKLNQIELERVINKYIWMTAEELYKAMADKATTMMERMIANIVMLAADKGDHQRLEFILARVIGRVQDRLEIKTLQPFIIRKRDGEEVQLGVEERDEDR